MKKLEPREVKSSTRSPEQLVKSITMTDSPGIFLRSQEELEVFFPFGMGDIKNTITFSTLVSQ